MMKLSKKHGNHHGQHEHHCLYLILFKLHSITRPTNYKTNNDILQVKTIVLEMVKVNVLEMEKTISVTKSNSIELSKALKTSAGGASAGVASSGAFIEERKGEGENGREKVRE
ncbi:hypothetical protein CIPAW_05G020200 [Carya illinoinensis]|uniref:Uncharacterized protein n=1 Tax=Carya illinoinensis TaxID=32201 RepID=A0A8T1QE37_CARIL|nr:hypothetical protein CIPAW_05G020200 [Carya illinoinensis]